MIYDLCQPVMVCFQLDYCSVIMHQSMSGIYVVITELPKTMDIQIGRRKKTILRRGFMAMSGPP